MRLLLTPLQIMTFYNAVANDGVMVKPQFVTAHSVLEKLYGKLSLWF